MTPAPALAASPSIDDLRNYPDGAVATPLYASAIGLVLIAIAAWRPRTWLGLAALLPLALAAFVSFAAMMFFGIYLLADSVDDTALVLCWMLPVLLTVVGVALWLRPPR